MQNKTDYPEFFYPVNKFLEVSVERGLLIKI